MAEPSHRLLKTVVFLGVLGAIAYGAQRRLGAQPSPGIGPVERPVPKPSPAMETAPATPAPAKKKAPPKKAPAKKKAPPKKSPAKKAAPPPPASPEEQ